MNAYTINQQLDSLEDELKGFETYEDDGMDYDTICAVQGLSRYA